MLLSILCLVLLLAYAHFAFDCVTSALLLAYAFFPLDYITSGLLTHKCLPRLTLSCCLLTRSVINNTVCRWCSQWRDFCAIPAQKSRLLCQFYPRTWLRKWHARRCDRCANDTPADAIVRKWHASRCWCDLHNSTILRGALFRHDSQRFWIWIWMGSFFFAFFRHHEEWCKDTNKYCTVRWPCDCPHHHRTHTEDTADNKIWRTGKRLTLDSNRRPAVIFVCSKDLHQALLAL